MAGGSPPPPGVHQLNSHGDRVPVPAEDAASSVDPLSMEQAARKKARGRKIRPGEDVIKDLARGKRTTINAHTPHGVRGVEQDIVEIALPTTKKATRRRAVFTSVDGQEYSFRTHKSDGKIDPDRNMVAVLMAMRELMVGGNPLNIFDAFRLKIHDAEGKLAYPFSEDSLRFLNAHREDEEERHLQPLADEEETSPFNLAEAEGEDD